MINTMTMKTIMTKKIMVLAMKIRIMLLVIIYLDLPGENDDDR
jgi:hypothetical protein